MSKLPKEIEIVVSKGNEYPDQMKNEIVELVHERAIINERKKKVNEKIKAIEEYLIKHHGSQRLELK